MNKAASILNITSNWKAFSDLIKKANPTKIFILTDTNTYRLCLPIITPYLPDSVPNHVLVSPDGETNKNLNTCHVLWDEMIRYNIDRNSLLINLGGGMITDMGGFIAQTIKRGIQFIHIPTTVLAMVDASIGGKNGVDFGFLKNQIGTFSEALCIVLNNSFLNTLPNAQLLSGKAEMYKHGLIESDSYLNKMFAQYSEKNTTLIAESIEIKKAITLKDPNESGIRKALNYGHTLGHAIESFCNSSKTKQALLHGEAIYIGILLANYISHKMYFFPKQKMDLFAKNTLKEYPKLMFNKEEQKTIYNLCLHDKKNKNGKILFVLLKDVGDTVLDCEVPQDIIDEAFQYYNNL